VSAMENLEPPSLASPGCFALSLSLFSHFQSAIHLDTQVSDRAFHLRVNPVSEVRRPPPTAARTRRPKVEETEKLLHALGYSRESTAEMASASVGAAYLFAIETAMRAGEICSQECQYVNERHVHLPQTKNGYARDVPLSAEARRIIDQPRSLNGEEGAVFCVSTASLDALFRKAKAHALIEDLHFHDTRREALTQISKVFGVMELVRISGHRDLRVPVERQFQLV
jgi:integrase